MSSTKKRWPGEQDEAFPEVFNTPPPLSGERKPGQLTEQQFKQFFDKGWLLVDSFFQPEELEPVKDSISQLVEDLAQKLYNAGKIKSLYKECGFYQRLTMIEREFPGANIILHKLGALPQLVENGHKKGRVAQHQCCHGGTWYVMLEEDEMEKTLGVKLDNDLKTVPVPYGGVLLFSNMLPHRSLNNFSDTIRWSLDLRWQRADRPLGFYGLKDGVRMRSSEDPNLTINWEAFDSVSRHDKANEMLEKKEEEFDVTIPGPWMKNWEITHTNEHTRALEALEAKGEIDFSKLNQMTG